MTQVHPFELEGMVSTLTVLRLLTDDLGAIAQALREKTTAMPGFFADAPVALDLSALEGTDDDGEGGEGGEDDAPRERREVPLRKLVELLRAEGLMPVGVRLLREARRAEARAAGLGALRGGKRKPVKPAEVAPAPVSAGEGEGQGEGEDRRSGTDRRLDDAKPIRSGSLILRTPLRSGQVVYAEQTDAIVLAAVNAGAELIADGSIHVYGALRGRALAGAHGDEEARIFTKSLEADLVAIAGCYLSSDEIPEARRGKPAHIYLERGKLIIGDI